MDLTTILAAGVASGTILLFAAIGEIFAERSGVLNLGVEGMMLMGAVAAFSVALSTGSPWLGVAAAMLAGGLLSMIHGVMTIHLRADQVVSGLALTFLGTGLARVLGEGLSSAGDVAQLPQLTVPLVSGIPVIGRIFFTTRACSCTSATCWCPSPGCGSRGHGRVCICGRWEAPAAADAQGIGVIGTRYAYVFVGGLLAGLAGATIALAIYPGWFGDQTVNGRGWIAIGLVIFAQWSPLRAVRGPSCSARSSGSSSTSRASTRSSAWRTRSGPATRRRSSWTCCPT
jgi:simple sugar transport system permease protein